MNGWDGALPRIMTDGSGFMPLIDVTDTLEPEPEA